MKKILILSIFFFSFIFGQGNRENSTNIVMRDGLLYRLDTYFRIGFDKELTPYSGQVFTVIKIEKDSDYNSYVQLEYNVLNGIKHGNYKKWNQDNLIKDINYKNGLFDGPYKIYYEYGQLLQESTYKDGKREGPYKSYHKNGQLKSESFYKDGNREGPYKSYHKNGQVEEEVTYKDGKEHEIYKSYYENGQLKKTGNYNNGLKHGQWIEYYTNGIVREKILYDSGKEKKN